MVGEVDGALVGLDNGSFEGLLVEGRLVVGSWDGARVVGLEEGDSEGALGHARGQG
jgi:hypothetical protein